MKLWQRLPVFLGCVSARSLAGHQCYHSWEHMYSSWLVVSAERCMRHQKTIQVCDFEKVCNSLKKFSAGKLFPIFTYMVIFVIIHSKIGGPDELRWYSGCNFNFRVKGFLKWIKIICPFSYFFSKSCSPSFTTSSLYSAVLAQYGEQMQKKTVWPTLMNGKIKFEFYVTFCNPFSGTKSLYF